MVFAGRMFSRVRYHGSLTLRRPPCRNPKPPSAFISYCRDDQEFALRLARLALAYLSARVAFHHQAIELDNLVGKDRPHLQPSAQRGHILTQRAQVAVVLLFQPRN
jgi:hypothetical protein